MKKSVLEYVQATLSVMDSDNVDSISDTEESLQVADRLFDIYYEFCTRETWKFMDKFVSVTVTDPTLPTSVTLPDEVKEVMLVSYDISVTTTPNYRELKYMNPVDFVRYTNQAPVVVVDGANVYKVWDDRAPTFWTSFDEKTIVLDSYVAELGTTVSADNFKVFANVIPEFTITDQFVPDLPDRCVPYLQHQLNSVCMSNLKQMESPNDVLMARRQYAMLQRRDSKFQKENYYEAKYGRR